jgi:predicted nucleic acid-binding protein
VTHRVFLDANVLFSAAWLEDSGLARLWRVPDATLITSRYALAEAERNLETDEQRLRLTAFAKSVQLVDAAAGGQLPDGVKLVEKDAPILLAAIEAGATHLLTGDRRHFADLYGRSIKGVRILSPSEYLKWI